MDKPWFKFYEPGVPHTLSYPDVPQHQLLEDSAKRFPQNPAVIFLNGKMTYAALDAAVNRLANALSDLGVKKGDRVAIYTANCPQYVISYYATLKIGAIVVPINPLYVAHEVEHQVNDAGAETIIVMSRFYPVVQKVRGHTKLKRVIVTSIKEYFPPVTKLLFTLVKEKKGGDAFVLVPGDHEWGALLSKYSANKPSHVASSADTAVLLYTGGTTGVSKGAELTHRNIVANSVQCKYWFGIRDGGEGSDIILTALPLFHSFGMTTCMNLGVFIGAALILIPNPRDLHDLLGNIAKHRPTIFPGVPTMYVAINNSPETPKYDLRSIKACLSGGAALPVEVAKRFKEITGANLVEGYGLSETSPVVTANPVFGDNRVGTIGVPFPDTDIKVMDLDTGATEMPVGEAGELAMMGPQVMKRYWNRPDETAIAMRGDWFYSGDIGTMSADGYITIVDRKKDMIIAGGFNIYPRDVEEVLYQHPKVQEVVVAGIPDRYRGETVKAYVVLKAGQTATPEEIMEFCKGKLAKFKVPTSVEFRDTLPKSMVGKILRRVLVEEEKQKLAAGS
jgi:long-chain acyl-CoA synthetase